MNKGIEEECNSAEKGSPGHAAPGPWQSLIAHDLDNEPLVTLTVKFCVKDALPRAEVEAPLGYGHNHFVMNEQAFQVRVAIVLACAVVPVIFAKRSQLLQPLVNVLDQA